MRVPGECYRAAARLFLSFFNNAVEGGRGVIGRNHANLG
jgi:hypothetical protein